jgi:predicted nucleic acid-binding protein
MSSVKSDPGEAKDCSGRTLPDKIIPDANVFLDFMFGRKLRSKAELLLRRAISEEVVLIVPTLMLDEITEVLCGISDTLEKAGVHLRFLDDLIQVGVLKIVRPNADTRVRAIQIARTGHKKSGFPELSDALYHAVAIDHHGRFLTNDKAHFSKTNQFGSIQGLWDYL